MNPLPVTRYTSISLLLLLGLLTGPVTRYTNISQLLRQKQRTYGERLHLYIIKINYYYHWLHITSIFRYYYQVPRTLEIGSSSEFFKYIGVTGGGTP